MTNQRFGLGAVGCPEVVTDACSNNDCEHVPPHIGHEDQHKHERVAHQESVKNGRFDSDRSVSVVGGCGQCWSVSLVPVTGPVSTEFVEH